MRLQRKHHLQGLLYKGRLYTGLLYMGLLYTGLLYTGPLYMGLLYTGLLDFCDTKMSVLHSHDLWTKPKNLTLKKVYLEKI